MSSKVNYGKYRVNTDGLVFRVDGYSQRSYSDGTQSWKDLAPSGLDATLTNTDLYDETSGYYKFRKGASENDFAAISGQNFTDLKSLGVLKDKDSSFSIEIFFGLKRDLSTYPDDGAVLFGNTDHNKSGYSYGLVTMTGNGNGTTNQVSGLKAFIASNKVNSAAPSYIGNSPWTGVEVILSEVTNPSISGSSFRHAAMTYNGNDGKMIGYLDGKVKGTGTFTLSNTSGFHDADASPYEQFYIGGNDSSGINVNIGMVSCYNRALSSGEVYGNCKAVKHRYGGGY
ncbi:hypothetical protein CMI37_28635 [Candidatus Pacearchaeota archaeon]|nr:hypothetical protein [Candidatus Pacearchaeota archaeon]